MALVLRCGKLLVRALIVALRRWKLSPIVNEAGFARNRRKSDWVGGPSLGARLLRLPRSSCAERGAG
jgi:hypothetical protein